MRWNELFHSATRQSGFFFFVSRCSCALLHCVRLYLNHIACKTVNALKYALKLLHVVAVLAILAAAVRVAHVRYEEPIGPTPHSEIAPISPINEISFWRFGWNLPCK